MRKTNTLAPAVLAPGTWHGEFYGKASGTIGTDVRSERASIAGICYMVVPARLTPPSSQETYRSVVWIGAVSNEKQQSSAGLLLRDLDPRLLSLTLKVTFSEISTIITLLREGLFTEFHFQVEPSGTDGGCDISGWSGSFAL